MTVAGRIQVGTSGWHYAHWRGLFYPEELPPSAWLKHYADEFGCVELNNSFYRLPSPAAIAEWTRQTPATFRFAVKASRSITHLHKLKNCARPLALLLERAVLFGPRLGPLLFQLPPRWRADPPRLESFLAMLPDGLRYAFEFRDSSWHSEEILQRLDAHGCAFCQFDLGGQHTPLLLSGGFVYVRLHGPARAYAGSYSRPSLLRWAKLARQWTAQGQDVYFFFDNDEGGCAIKDARRLRGLLQADRE